MLLWISFAKSNIGQKSESTFKVWKFWMIQNFTHLFRERWVLELIGFWMIFPTLIFNRSLSLIDSCFQRTFTNFFTLYSPLSLLQTILILVCLFFVFSMLCFGVSPLFFSVNCCNLFNTNGLSSQDQNFVLFWHILSISIVKLLNKNAKLRHRTKQWKVEPQTNKKV